MNGSLSGKSCPKSLFLFTTLCNRPALRHVEKDKDREKMLSALKQFVSPAYYAGHYHSVVKWTNKKVIAGSIEPLFYGMGIVAGVGYLTKYLVAGSKFLLYIY